MTRTATFLAGLLLLGAAAPAQQRPGPVTPPKTEVKRLPKDKPPEPPPIPVDELIRRFTEHEDELKRAHEMYNYRLAIRVREYDEKGEAGGEWKVVSDVVFKPDGTRVARIIERTPSTLKRASFAPEDLEQLASLPLFILTTDQRDRYDITYDGKQPLDELTTYIFRVRPKRLDRRIPQYDGLVWVDDRDFTVVKSYGQMVREVDDDSDELPFKMYETYREFTDGKYWFPTYARSDAIIPSENGDSRLRLTIRMTDFRPREETK